MAVRRRARRQAAAEAIDMAPVPAASVPMPRPRLRYPPIEVVSADRIEAIHRASLRILADTGMKVLHDPAREILRRAGADVRDGDQIVRFDPAFVEETIAQAPSQFELEARNPARSLTVGDGSIIFSTVGGPAFVDDLDRGRRTGTLAELRDFTKIIQSLDIFHQEGGSAFEAMDVPKQYRHLELHRLQITVMDKNWAPWGLGWVRARDAIEMQSIALGTTREAISASGRVIFTCVINTNSPLMLDVPMCEGLIEMASHGQCVVITPFTLAGAMAPVTLAGALAQQNAEALAGMVLAQAVRPGVPVSYGGFTTNVDMRTGSPAFGTPEYMQAAQITGQLARRYGIPFRSSNTTASNCCDAQAAWESQMSLWGAVMGGASMIKHCAGWLGGGLTASFEKLVMDADLLEMMAAYLVPPEVDEAALAVETIGAVGHGGHFFGEPHTLERYRTAFHAPRLADWSNYETWAENGSKTAAERANALWKKIVAEYEAPPIDPGVAEAIDAYVSRRRAEIDAGQGVPDE